MVRYKILSVKTVKLDELRPQASERKLSPRQIIAMQREKEIKAAIDEAAVLPASEAVVIQTRKNEKMSTVRAAVDRILKEDSRDLNWGVRGPRIVISRGTLPGKRKASRPGLDHRRPGVSARADRGSVR